MPPQRTFTPAKVVNKTERTHEENQERAYIAASRRSDRSLEARVESARRASEIHKRRTGRSLRVTEQDVINEEMYEEEDDDLPLQYRRLTAHLQTGSADFNRRLNAYLTNQVAIRSALEQMVTQNYAQQYPGAPQFAHNHVNSFPSPLNNANMKAPSPSTYRSAPYPPPGTSDFRPHNRSASFAVPQDQANTVATSPPQYHAQVDRRMSMPTASASPAPHGSSLSTTPTIKQEDGSDSTEINPNSVPASYRSTWPPNLNHLTTALPLETQQLLGGALDTSDPFASMLMSGSEPFVQNQYYPWQQGQAPSTGRAKAEPEIHPSWNSMSATLAPSALDMTDPTFSHDSTLTEDGKRTESNLLSSALDFSFDSSYKGIGLGSLSREHSVQGVGSGQLTPGDGIWDDFINEGGSWGEEPGQ